MPQLTIEVLFVAKNRLSDVTGQQGGTARPGEPPAPTAPLVEQPRAPQQTRPPFVPLPNPTGSVAVAEFNRAQEARQRASVAPLQPVTRPTPTPTPIVQQPLQLAPSAHPAIINPPLPAVIPPARVQPLAVQPRVAQPPVARPAPSTHPAAQIPAPLPVIPVAPIQEAVAQTRNLNEEMAALVARSGAAGSVIQRAFEATGGNVKDTAATLRALNVPSDVVRQVEAIGRATQQTATQAVLQQQAIGGTSRALATAKETVICEILRG